MLNIIKGESGSGKTTYITNLLANMVKNGVGAAFCFHLDMEYDGLRFVPLAPRLETGAVLAWKKNQIFSSAATRFIETLKHSI